MLEIVDFSQKKRKMTIAEARADRISKICMDILLKYDFLFRKNLNFDQKIIKIYNIAIEYPANPVIITKILTCVGKKDIKKIVANEKTNKE